MSDVGAGWGAEGPPAGRWDLAITHVLVEEVVACAPTLRVAALRGGPVDGSYQALVTRIGTDVSEAGRLQSNAEVLTRSVDDRRESVSGVAMDEEMTNLVRFQRGYQASARAMSTMDEMLDVLINRTGRVGL